MTWQNPMGTVEREFDEIWDIRHIPATPSMATALPAIGTSRVCRFQSRSLTVPPKARLCDQIRVRLV
jgi:hypothetical protein